MLPTSTQSSTGHAPVSAPERSPEPSGAWPGSVPGLGDPVPLVDEHDAGAELARLAVVHRGVGDQDHQVTWVYQVGRRAVDPEHPAAALAGDDIGLQASAVGDVHDGHLFAGQQVGGVQQVGVDGDRADVVEVGTA